MKLFQETKALIAHLVTPQNTCTQNDQSKVYFLPGAAQTPCGDAGPLTGCRDRNEVAGLS